MQLNILPIHGVMNTSAHGPAPASATVPSAAALAGENSDRPDERNRANVS